MRFNAPRCDKEILEMMHKEAVVIDAAAKDNRWLMRERDKSKNVGTNKV